MGPKSGGGSETGSAGGTSTKKSSKVDDPISKLLMSCAIAGCMLAGFGSDRGIPMSPTGC